MADFRKNHPYCAPNRVHTLVGGYSLASTKKGFKPCFSVKGWIIIDQIGFLS